MEVDVPVGYHFRPTDVELLFPHLQSKVEGRPLTVPIPTLNVYDMDPWSLPPGLQGVDGFFYCFTQLRRCSNKDRRVKRSVGSSGTWYTNNTTVVTGVGGQVVGYRTFLSYQVNGKHTGWVMYEYRLKEEEEDCSSSVRLEEDVICKIKNGKRKRVEDGDQRRCDSGSTVDGGSSQSLQLSTSPESVLHEEGRGGVPTGGTESSSLGYFMDHLEVLRWDELVQLCEGDGRLCFSPEELLGDGGDSDVVGRLQPSTSPEVVPGMEETFTFPSMVEQQGSGGVRLGDGDQHIFYSLESLLELPHLGHGDHCVVLGNHCLQPEPLHVTVQEMIPSIDETFSFPSLVDQQRSGGHPMGGTGTDDTPLGGHIDHRSCWVTSSFVSSSPL